MPFPAFAAAVARPATYRYDTPLQWAIQEGRKKTDEFVLITDGMETGARLSGLLSSIDELAQSGWAIGVAGTLIHFSGTYYTEMEIVIRDDLPKVEEAIHAVNPDWKASPTACPHNQQNCYFFEGDRPVLLLMFSRSGSLAGLSKSIVTALKENQLDASRVLQIAPFRPLETEPQIRAVGGPAKRLLVLPNLAAHENQLRCLVNDRPLPVEITVHPKGTLDPPQPSELRIINVRVSAQTQWARPRSQRAANDSQTILPLDIVCHSSLLHAPYGGPYVPQKGQLEIQFEQTWSNAASGWWLDWDAPNPWQYPNKVYKLAEVVETVHRNAMNRSVKAKPPLSKLTLAAAGPR